MFACIGFVILSYLISAVIGAVWTSPRYIATNENPEYTIYVSSNGFHSDIIIPFSDKILEKLPIGHGDFPDLLIGAKHLIIGWGSQTAYTSLLDLTDMSPAIMAKSLFFDDSVLHVQPLTHDLKNSSLQPIHIKQSQLDQLLQFIVGTFTTDEKQQSVVLNGATHGHGDIFYRAKPLYQMFYSCNVWTGQALRIAGIKMGYWTPFAQSIEWGLTQNHNDQS